MGRGNGFGKLEIKGKRIKQGRQSGPLAGARARVEAAGGIDRKVSAGRAVMLGPLALLAKKKVDKRELYIIVTGAGFEFVERADPDKGMEAREFAARLNTLAGPPLPTLPPGYVT